MIGLQWWNRIGVRHCKLVAEDTLDNSRCLWLVIIQYILFAQVYMPSRTTLSTSVNISLWKQLYNSCLFWLCRSFVKRKRDISWVISGLGRLNRKPVLQTVTSFDRLPKTKRYNNTMKTGKSRKFGVFGFYFLYCSWLFSWNDWSVCL